MVVWGFFGGGGLLSFLFVWGEFVVVVLLVDLLWGVFGFLFSFCFVFSFTYNCPTELFSGSGNILD